MSCIQWGALQLWGLHFHIDGFFFFPFLFSFQRWWGRKLGRITSNDPAEAFLSKAARMHFIRAQCLWIMYVGGRQLYWNRIRLTGPGATRRNTHTHPLTANAIKGRIRAKSIRTNLCEMKWNVIREKWKDEMEQKKQGRRPGFTQAWGLLLSTLWTIKSALWQKQNNTSSKNETNFKKKKKTCGWSGPKMARLNNIKLQGKVF